MKKVRVLKTALGLFCIYSVSYFTMVLTAWPFDATIYSPAAKLLNDALFSAEPIFVPKALKTSMGLSDVTLMQPPLAVTAIPPFSVAMFLIPEFSCLKKKSAKPSVCAARL